MNADSPRSTVVLRPGALGDTLLSVPALRALRLRLPEAQLLLAGQRGAARLLQEAGEVDVGVSFEDPRIVSLWGGTGDWPWAPPRRVVAWLSDSTGALRHGLERLAVEAVIIAPSRPSGEGVHCAEHLLRSLAAWGVAEDLDSRPLALAPWSSPVVAIHPGSGAARKNWPAERFAAVVRRLREAGVPVALVVGEADEAAATALETVVGARLERWEQLPLQELARRLAGCAAYLGNDSGVSHLAGLAGARTVALFGPTSASMWHPLGPRVSVLPFDTPPDAAVEALGG